MATSNEMMRPVILSRPANTAVGLVMRCGGGSTTISSPGCGAVLTGCGGAPCGCRTPGGRPGSACTGPAAPDGCGATGTPGRLDGGRLIGAGSGCAGG